MISNEILHLLKISSHLTESKHLEEDFTFDWSKIEILLSEHDYQKDLESKEKCLNYKRLIDPLIQETGKVSTYRKSFIAVLKNYSLWTNSTTELIEIFNTLDESSNSVTVLLRVTSILEFSLGNVYSCLTRRKPSHLLKDLLNELSTLNDVFKPKQIFLLQIILGTSKGLNLRNIAWHGFIDTVDVHYVTFLFVIILSYGKLLNKRIISPTNRPEISLDLPFNDETKNFDDLLNSSTIKKTNFFAWSTVISLYKIQNSKAAIFLLLSQTESLLRAIYGQINHVDIIARLDRYYIILDSIFYEYVLDEDFTPLVIGKINKAQELEIRRKNQRNRMLEVFPSQLLFLGYDIFHAVDGPRVRDKISHGESICNENSDEIVMKLLQFVRHVVRFHDNKITPPFQYESVYMNSFKVARNYNVLIFKVEKAFQDLKIPESLALRKALNFVIDLNEINVQKVKGFFRPFCETEMMKLLLKNLENVNKALLNFSYSCNDFFNQFNAKSLSSSRRETLKQMIIDLPNLFKGFQEVLRIVYESFAEVQKVDSSETNFEKLSKFLKNCLKFTENLVKHYFHDTRNFHLANKKSCEFLKLIDTSC